MRARLIGMTVGWLCGMALGLVIIVGANVSGVFACLVGFVCGGFGCSLGADIAKVLYE